MLTVKASAPKSDSCSCSVGYRVFIIYIFFKFKKNPDSGLSLFSLGVSVCTHTRQGEHQRCSKTGRVQKNHEHPVPDGKPALGFTLVNVFDHHVTTETEVGNLKLVINN